MRAIGLLCGVGSLLREAADVGFRVVGNLETRAPYRTGRHLCWDLNFPNAEFRHIPFANPMADTWPDDWFEADLAIGHPPCGSFSTLGYSGYRAEFSDEQRAAARAKRESKVGLLPLFTEQVRLLRPRCFALDNLPKILSTVAPKEWWKAELPDYRLTFLDVLNWDYGTPQLRRRLWVIGFRRPVKKFNFVPPSDRIAGPKTALDAMSDLPWEPWIDEPLIGHVHVAPHQMLTGDYRTTVSDFSVTRAAELALGFLSIPPDKAWPYRTRTGRIAVKIGRQRLAIDKYSRTTTGLPSIHHPVTGWPLTARERARLLDWPDDFRLGSILTQYDRTALMRLTLFTGKAIPSGFPRYLLPQLVKHLRRNR